MNKIRMKLNEIVREEVNKLAPHIMTGKLSEKEYGLGDLLTYRLGYRHLGVVVGASIPFFGLMQGFGYNIPNVIANAIMAIPFEIPFAGAGYIVGLVGDMASKTSGPK